MPQKTAVLIVCDGLRADRLDPEVTPTICQLDETASRFPKYRGIFPSVTRVTSACISTGCLPGTHGLAGNTIALDEGAGLIQADAGKPEFIPYFRRVTGRTLKVPTLAERLTNHGGAIIFSNVSPGGAYFQDPDGYGYVYHRAGSYGPGRVPVPADDQLIISNDAAGDAIMTERFCSEVLGERRPTLAVLWLCEPDHTGHAAPLGSPAYQAALQATDHHVAQVIATLEERDPAFEKTLLLVCADHVLETERRRIPVSELLVEAGLKEAVDSREVVVAPNGSAALIYLAADMAERRDAIAAYLRRQDWVDTVFAGDKLAQVGQPPLDGLAIAVSLRHTDERNPYDVPGYADVAVNTHQEATLKRHGTHGGLGQYEQGPFLRVRGGGYPGGLTVDSAVQPISIAPTILQHLGLPYEGLDGSPLSRS